ncbi:MAG TPA: polyprenyl synthetase family protein [Frankiaceae bacterium]|nr:polyprenyl synthetase family protein [Frankiaceae bacterium]
MPTGTTAASAAADARDPARLSGLSLRVSDALATFLDRAEPVVTRIGPELEAVAAATREFVLAGGKRLRPAFCYWGWRGTGAADCDGVLNAAASLELLHACALIHDDVIDASDTRRDRPSTHRRFAELHLKGGWRGDPEAFGASAAILLGDLCLVWADQMFGECGLEPAAIDRARGTYAEMRVELMAGQYLDVLASVLTEPDSAAATERALRVARYKSAKYTVERPLQLGGMLAGASADLLAAYSAYGLPLGEAFQLRDDILGVFGDPAVTGKPAGDDLREGKRTALVTLAEQRASPAAAAQLRALVGDPDLDAAGVATCRQVISESGALGEVEELILRRGAQAREALDVPTLDRRARRSLEVLAAAVTDRIG